MIESLILNNVQIHKKLKIEFGPNITTIIGPTDAGKSAVIRALGLVLTNKPNSKSFVTHGEKQYKITLNIDGRQIKKVRSIGAKNLYYLDGRVLKSFGSGKVPDPVQALVKVGSSTIQGQMDPPFWIFDSPSVLSKKINKIVNIDLIDRLIARSTATIKRNKIEKDLVGKRLREATESVQKLKWIKRCDADLRQLETHENRLVEIASKIAKFQSFLKKRKKLQLSRESVSNLILDAKKLIQIGKENEHRRKTIEKLESLKRAIDHSGKMFLLFEDWWRLYYLREKGDKIAERRRVVIVLLDKYRECVSEIKRTKKSLTILEAQYKKASKGRCPVCGKVLKRK